MSGRNSLADGLGIGGKPVIAFSFARIKETTYLSARKRMCQIITELYNKYDFIRALLLDDVKAMNHYMNRVNGRCILSDRNIPLEEHSRNSIIGKR